MCGKFNIQRICNLTEHVSLFGGLVKWRGKPCVSAPGEAGETFCYNRDGKKSNNVIVVQGCILCLTCSHPELTEDDVVTSAYVKIFRAVTRNAVNKSV